MVDILFATEVARKKSYLVKSIDMSIFSLDEFAYFYAKNTILLDNSIMQEDFEYWIREELRLPDIAEQLRQIREEKGTCIDYFNVVLSQTVIFRLSEKAEIIENVRRFANKNESQRRKILGDQLFVREKYQSAIREYVALTKEECFTEELESFKGSVWHNLGCCYGMCFLFEEALKCFREAYSYNFSQQTQNAVAFTIKAQTDISNTGEPLQESFLNYLDYTAQDGRDSRYKEIAQRVTNYRRGVEE